MVNLMAFEPSPQQREILEFWGQPLVVVAGAGCGKTTTLVEKAKGLVARNPEARICAVSFTEKSAADLRDKLGPHLDLGRHWVRTIHGLCSGVIRQFPHEAGLLGGETVVDSREADRLWNDALKSLWFGEWSDPALQDAWVILEKRETVESLRTSLGRARALWFNGLKDVTKGSPELQAFLSIARHVMDRYAQIKAKAGSLDFQDLEVRALQALRDSRVRSHYHAAFDLIMIDEFQDTNPLQAELLWLFVRPDQSNLVVVGDPKQSIYGFREADVTVFNDRAEEILRSGQRLDLSVNRRSRPEIIDYVNAICGKIFPRAGLPYDPLQAHRDSEPSDTPAVGRLLASVRGDGPGGGPQTLVAWLRSQVATGTPLSDFAILLRKVKGNLRWLEALRDAGFPTAISSGGFFWDDVRVRELVALLRWWDQPANEKSAVTFFRAPWVAVPDRLIDDWMFSKPRQLWDQFLSSPHPLATVLSAVRGGRAGGEAVRPGQVLESLLGDPDRERELGSQILGLWHKAEALSAQGFTFHEVVSRFENSISGGEREREIPPPEDAGHLRVLTVHAAKGLEFPRVILLDFPDFSRAEKTPFLFWDRKRGAEVAVIDEEGERDETADLERSWRGWIRERNLQESLRVFYVALTRARDHIVMVLEPSDKNYSTRTDLWRQWIEYEGPSLPTLALGDGANLSTPSSPSKATPVAGQAAPRNSRSPSGHPIRHRARHSVSEWLVLSKCPRQYEWTYLRPRFSSETGKALREDDFSKEGVRIHAEKAQEAFRQEDGGGVERWPELSFEVPVGASGTSGTSGTPEVVVGTLDLLEQRGSAFRIVDFKVTRSTRSEVELRAQYQLQLELYAWAVNSLAPESRDSISACLVNIHDGIEKEIGVSLPPFAQLEARVQGLLKQAQDVIASDSGAEPKPGAHCGVCSVKMLCPNRAS